MLLAITRAALASAVMFMGGALIPAVGGIAMILAPTPVLHSSIGYRNAFWRSVIIALLSAGLVGIGGGVGAVLTYLATAGIASAGMCYLIEKRQPFERIVGSIALLILLIGAVSAIVLAGSPQALAEQLRNNLTLTIARGEKFYAMLGLNTTITPDIRAGIVEMILRMMPALALISAALLTLANLATFWRIGGRQARIGYPLFGDLARWSTPEWLIWVLLVSGFGLFVPVVPLRTIFLNCFVCVAVIYLCQGLAIMSFYFHVLAMPWLARLLVYTITIIQPILAVLVCAAGILDMWIDFRRLKPSNPQTRKLGDFL
jgi:uncharacterized protein YybS (DUF2232 family)